MSYRIQCWCLFDTTRTGVIHRNKPGDDEDPKEWILRRNSQCNFDTILQVISLRSQPELLTDPEKIELRFDSVDYFGFLFSQQDDELYPCWKFDFEVQHPNVFEDGISELGGLYRDCDRVPMILCGTEWNKLPSFLDVSPELRNIYFEAYIDQE